MKAFTLLTGLAVLAGAALAESIPAESIPAESIPVESDPAGERVFDAMDRDGDGAVSAAEYAIHEGRTHGVPVEDALAEFDAISGGDGSLSPQDWAAHGGDAADAIASDGDLSMDAIADEPEAPRTTDGQSN